MATKRTTKKKVEVAAVPVVEHKPHVMSEKTRLLGLYEQLQNLNVRSISDLEVLISRAD